MIDALLVLAMTVIIGVTGTAALVVGIGIIRRLASLPRDAFASSPVCTPSREQSLTGWQPGDEPVTARPMSKRQLRRYQEQLRKQQSEQETIAHRMNTEWERPTPIELPRREDEAIPCPEWPVKVKR